MDYQSGAWDAHISCTCSTIICKITHYTGSESAVAQMVRLRFGLGFKFKPRSELSYLACVCVCVCVW